MIEACLVLGDPVSISHFCVKVSGKVYSRPRGKGEMTAVVFMWDLRPLVCSVFFLLSEAWLNKINIRSSGQYLKANNKFTDKRDINVVGYSTFLGSITPNE